MKSRKAADLRSLTTQELESFLKEAEENVTKLRFQQVLGQLHDVASIRVLRKDIARMKTLIAERARTV
jgi:large subunit ribosomal protein L29